MLEAIERTEMYLHNDTFERLVVGRGKTDAKVLPTAIQVHSLRLTLTEKARLRSIAEEATSTIDEKMQEGIESYALKVPEFGGGRDGGVAMLQANTSLGLLRGLQTFGQMWYAYEGTKYLLNAPIEIEDGPAFVCIPLNHLETFLTIAGSSRIEASHLILPGICEICGPLRGGFALIDMFNSYPIADILRTLDAMSWVKVQYLKHLCGMMMIDCEGS